MARHLFDYITFDLDSQEIVDFRLKPWADQFLVLHTALYAEENKNDYQIDDSRIVPTGLELTPLPLANIVDWFLTSTGFKTTLMHTRDELIRLRYVAGETLSDIARAFDISPQRVFQIVRSKSK